MLRRKEEDLLVAVDAGGTTIRTAVFSRASLELLERRDRATPHYGTGSDDPVLATVTEICDLFEDLFPSSSPGCAVVAFPGPIDPNGELVAAPTISGTSGDGPRNLVGLFEDRRPHDAFVVMNDLSAAGYRYVGDGRRDFCIMTIGSGIGHKVFVDGKPLVGPNGRGGEIGHLRVDHSDDAPQCDCGARGHLGSVASGRGAVATTIRSAISDREGFAASALGECVSDPDAITTHAIARAFAADDPWTTAVIRRIASWIGRSVAAIHLAVGVEEFWLIGGFTQALGDPFRAMIAAEAARSTWDLGQPWDEIVRLGPAGDEDGLRGAAWFGSQLLTAKDRSGRGPRRV